MEVFQELADVLLAVRLSVRLVEQLEHPYEDLERLLDNLRLDCGVEEELLEDPDGRHAELTVTESDQEVVLHLAQDSKPRVQVFVPEIKLCARVEDLNVRPLEVL
jgi:hypothetical protein